MPPPELPTAPTHVVFLGARRVAQGSVAEVLPVIRRHTDSGGPGVLLVFELTTGKQVELDEIHAGSSLQVNESDAVKGGPGRPRLGVLSREVSLLPRHWDWLGAQGQGISATLRRLVEQAIRSPSQAERRQNARAAVSRFLFAMAGNRPNYEEACRALFTGDAPKFGALIRQWPKGIQQVAQQMAEAAFA